MREQVLIANASVEIVRILTSGWKRIRSYSSAGLRRPILLMYCRCANEAGSHRAVEVDA